MARRVWVLPSTLPSDAHGEGSGGAPSHSVDPLRHGDPQRLLVRLRAKRKARMARADAIGSEAEPTPQDTSS